MSVEITLDLLDDLLDKANSATPGPWTTETTKLIGRNGNTASWVCKNEMPLQMHGAKGQRNAEFISAVNPETVIALINEIRALKMALICSF
jgi:hypothetical protein